MQRILDNIEIAQSSAHKQHAFAIIKEHRLASWLGLSRLSGPPGKTTTKASLAHLVRWEINTGCREERPNFVLDLGDICRRGDELGEHGNDPAGAGEGFAGVEVYQGFRGGEPGAAAGGGEGFDERVDRAVDGQGVGVGDLAQSQRGRGGEVGFAIGDRLANDVSQYGRTTASRSFARPGRMPCRRSRKSWTSQGSTPKLTRFSSRTWDGSTARPPPP